MQEKKSDEAGADVHAASPLPLAGLKVLELGQLIAGPFCGKTLGDFGAQVIKIEPPGKGDPLRKWRMLKDGTSVWWQVQSRNKQSVTVNLREAQGQELIRSLVAETDVLVENFRPGAMEEWGLGWEVLSKINPGLIMLRISGYGQDGPYRDRPGFAAIAEAVGGLRYLTGEPGRVPVRCGVSIGDTISSLHGAIGVMIALYHRVANGGRGQVVDVALSESVLNCMESLIPEYSAFGAVREPAGSAMPGIAPSNAYPCADGMVLVAGNGDSIFKRLMNAMGRADLADAPDLEHNDGRVKRIAEIDAAISQWTQTRPADQVLETLIAARVPCGKLYNAADIAADPQYRARGAIQTMTTADGSTLDVPGVLPRLSETPGKISSLAPELGADTEAVLRSIGVDPERFAALRKQGVI
tara:strand:+ start:226 stop:1461 length:1236 start_codon:yes stop_codon:yes gene_type:complete